MKKIISFTALSLGLTVAMSATATLNVVATVAGKSMAQASSAGWSSTGPSDVKVLSNLSGSCVEVDINSNTSDAVGTKYYDYTVTCNGSTRTITAGQSAICASTKDVTWAAAAENKPASGSINYSTVDASACSANAPAKTK